MPVLPRRVFLSASAGLIATQLCAGFATAQATQPPAGRRIALSGYDPVAYFTDRRPERGVRTHWFAFDDAVYLFSSEKHRAMFAADPERYAPQYAGFCAAGVSKGYKAEPDPEAWVIVQGKLYVLQLKERVADFKKNPEAFIAKAEANWPALRKAAVKQP